MTDAAADLEARRASFLRQAHDYERYRPGYPTGAIRWLIGSEPKRVLDVGCGPGNLSSQLVELGHDVVGVDPSATMLQAAARKRIVVVQAVAERLPFRTCVDVVAAATAFHWFHASDAVPEMRRVLRLEGRVALLTNMRDETVSWVEALSEIIGSESAMAATLGGAEGIEVELVSKLEDGGHFRDTEHRVFEYEQRLTRDELVGLVRSRSYVAILPEDEREALLRSVEQLCREHPDLAGKDSFPLRYKTHAFRSVAS